MSQSQQPTRIIKKKWLRKMYGYARAPRQEFLLANGLLNDSELILYLLLRDCITTWDKSKDYYGTFEFDPMQIEYILGWSVDKTNRIFRSLKKLQIVETVDKRNGLYQVIKYGQYCNMLYTGALKPNRLKYLEQFCNFIKENYHGGMSNIHQNIANFQLQLHEKISHATYSDSKSSLSSNVYGSLKQENNIDTTTQAIYNLDEPLDEETESDINAQFNDF